MSRIPPISPSLPVLMFRARGEKDLLSSDAIFPLVVDYCLRCLRAKEKKQENEILSRGQPSNPPDSARPLPFPESLTFSRENEGWMRHISEDGIISLLLSFKNLLTLLLLSIQTNPLFLSRSFLSCPPGKGKKKIFRFCHRDTIETFILSLSIVEL